MQRAVKNSTLAFVVTLFPCAVVAQDTVTETFEVTASVPASCVVENVGTLEVTFDETATEFDATNPSEATFDVTCQGAPTVTAITFDGGLNQSAQLRQMAKTDDATAKIAYNFYAFPSSDTIQLANFMTPGGTLSYNAALEGTETFKVAAAATATNQGDGPDDIAFGVYEDTVTITVAYN